MKSRVARIVDLLDLFTCPHCNEIKDLERRFNGVKLCFDCYSRACAGALTLKTLALRETKARIKAALDENYFEGAVEEAFKYSPDFTRDQAVDLVQQVEKEVALKKSQREA